MAEGIGLDIMSLDDSTAQQGERRHTQPAGEEVLDDGEGLEWVRPQQRDVGVEIPRCGVEIFIRESGVIGEQIRSQLNALSCVGGPVAGFDRKAVRNERERLAGQRACPLRDYKAGLTAALDWARPDGARLGLRDGGPTLRQGDLQVERAERLCYVWIPLRFTAEVDAFGSDMSGCFAGGDEAQVPGFSGRIVDDPMIGQRQTHRADRHRGGRDRDHLSGAAVLRVQHFERKFVRRIVAQRHAIDDQPRRQ